MNLGRGAEDSSMTRLDPWTERGQRLALRVSGLSHANQYGRRSCPTSTWIGRVLTHSSGGAISSVCVLGAGSGLHIYDPAAPT
jgi:hypothetical protein